VDHLLESSLTLLARARSGDGDALDQLLQRYLPRLRRWASGRLPHTARNVLDTDDVVQETVIKTVRNLGRIEIRNDGALQAYLRQALSNRLADAYRQSQRRANDTGLKSDLPARQPSPLEHAIGADAVHRYEIGLTHLADSDRELVILRIEFCYEYDEIARMTGKTSAASARVAVSRALARLSKEMRHAV
jgi:RNA polymerase sigma-70 factor (ECF subfamily)